MGKDMHEKVRLGIAGLDGRGQFLLSELLVMDDVDIIALCDLYEDRLEASVKLVVDSGRKAPEAYTDYRYVTEHKDIDGIITPSSWTSHSDVIISAMKAGKYAATEVGGAASLEECFELVRVSENTGMPCMMLENCCYGREEMAVLNMVKNNVFGELIHCQCGYIHDLREEVCQGHIWLIKRQCSNLRGNIS